MTLWRSMRRRARAALLPLGFLAFAGYFVWQATQGDRGLMAHDERAQDLALARAQLARAEAERAVWERRVGGLRGGRLDSDALDERARAMLNLADPGDIVLLYPPGQRLF